LTCGITTAGDEFCWGDGHGSQPKLGWNGWGAQSGGPKASATAVSDGFSCRLDGFGVWCDGAPAPGSQALGFSFLGQGTTAKHVCAIAGSGTTWCWGDSTSGKLGNGTPVNGRTPVNAPSLLTSVAAGRNHSCGLAGTTAFCWGSNVNGELGINTGPGGGSSAPRQVTNGSGTPAWSKISAGDRHTCAIDTGGQIWCWGSNYMGQLGINATFTYNAALGIQAIVAPVRIVGL
jgi:alpha-tubulin suppressor-like RCC1 family protein